MLCGAGYETTANTLAFTTYILSANPKKAEKLIEVYACYLHFAEAPIRRQHKRRPIALICLIVHKY